MGEIFPEKPMGSPAVPVVRVLPAAPELAAAMAEAGKVRARLAELCEEFGPSAQSGWSARISLTVLNRYRADAGIGPLSRTPSNDREDTMLRYRRERDEARAELAEMQALTAEDLAPILWDAYAASFLSALRAERVEALRAKWTELSHPERASWLAAAGKALSARAGLEPRS